MIKINLLPWREKKREYDRKTMLMIIGGAATIALFLVMVGYFHTSSLINNQMNRNQMLTNEIDQLNNKLKDIKELQVLRRNLIARMKIVYDLQKRRPLGVRLFEVLINIMPDGVYLTEIQRTVNVVMVVGHADSNSSVSALMKNIVDNPWVQAPVLTEIKKVSDDKLHNAEYNEFKLSFILQPDSIVNGAIKPQ